MPLICYHIVYILYATFALIENTMENNNQQESEKKVGKNKKKFITPQEVQFYFKSSWYLLFLFLVFEFLIMFILSKAEWGGKNFILWLIRIILFYYVFWKIGKRFKQINLSLFGSILGLEIGIIVSVVKIITNSGAQWTWFNLFTEPLYIMGLGALVGFGIHKINF